MLKDRLSILFLSGMLLIAVSYVQIFHRILNDNRFLVEVASEVSNDAEEEAEKSTEENERETDQDEDPFHAGEIILLPIKSDLSYSKNESYSFGLFGFYPEIVSPPPQA